MSLDACAGGPALGLNCHDDRRGSIRGGKVSHCFTCQFCCFVGCSFRPLIQLFQRFDGMSKRVQRFLSKSGRKSRPAKD